ncbi:hypothetical protein ACFQX6_12940 [Streptosporangium lutulentum]
MQPWKPCSASKMAALASVRCPSRVSSLRTAASSPPRARRASSSNSTARLTHTAHWPRRPPTNSTSTSSPSTTTRCEVIRSDRMWSSLPV